MCILEALLRKKKKSAHLAISSFSDCHWIYNFDSNEIWVVQSIHSVLFENEG